ncbi:hypothetical protein QJQ45_022791 [Haematococcus lacustris]|nr:hypothetical protein QJQ45_022791 [Haematococcus lacustris]
MWAEMSKLRWSNARFRLYGGKQRTVAKFWAEVSRPYPQPVSMPAAKGTAAGPAARDTAPRPATAAPAAAAGQQQQPGSSSSSRAAAAGQQQPGSRQQQGGSSRSRAADSSRAAAAAGRQQQQGDNRSGRAAAAAAAVGRQQQGPGSNSSRAAADSSRAAAAGQQQPGSRQQQGGSSSSRAAAVAAGQQQQQGDNGSGRAAAAAAEGRQQQGPGSSNSRAAANSSRAAAQAAGQQQHQQGIISSSSRVLLTVKGAKVRCNSAATGRPLALAYGAAHSRRLRPEVTRTISPGRHTADSPRKGRLNAVVVIEKLKVHLNSQVFQASQPLICTSAGFRGSGSIGSKGVPVKQMLREACKQFPGRVVLVHEFRTSRVSSARTNVVQGQAESFRWLYPVRSMAKRSRIRGLMCSTSSVIKRGFYDRDVSAALNIRRIAAGPGRPRELSSWLGRPAMPNPGRPGQEWVQVRDRGLLRKWQRRHQRQRQ